MKLITDLSKQSKFSNQIWKPPRILRYPLNLALKTMKTRSKMKLGEKKIILKKMSSNTPQTRPSLNPSKICKVIIKKMTPYRV